MPQKKQSIVLFAICMVLFATSQLGLWTLSTPAF
jgi:thiol:disulfide interchange protein